MTAPADDRGRGRRRPREALRRLLRAALLPLLVLWAGAACASTREVDVGTAGDAAAGTQAPSGAFIYVTNEGEATVSVIDTRDDELVTTVDLKERGFGPDAKPHHVVVEPDGSHWYVSLIGANTVLKLDRDNRIVGRAEFETPGLMTLEPENDVLYVGRSMKAVNPPQRVGRIVREDMSIEEVDVFFPRPHAIEMSEDGRRVWSASLSVDRIATVPMGEEERPELTSLEGGHRTLLQFGQAPDGSRLVATGEMSGTLMVFDVTADGTPRLAREVEVGARPWHPVFSPDGSTVYVPLKDEDAVAFVSTEDWTVQRRVEGRGLAEPHGSALSPDGRKLYVSNNNLKGGYRPEGTTGDEESFPGTVVVIDTETGEILEVIEVGHNPSGVGAAPAR